ncbi:hypothetical protein FD29_GL000154 [Companilactobacillus mindensis DSM 14500]|jgi:hypothetical protein|uniref:Uncharacterized protein n=1 Tax=Companilactobacillus mindensis DSM 14500 TaxID=1423770 RepID=A0A0R1QHB4_9LACO|nr:hypothetical protein [Companilactobacillus mindensis]KRL44263.1 hypothetical protein FD29_GL000154 [Companilactobacillus mindensis DSM 14500]GEO79791.1 hypothetical protein LMI01_21220 [Companilactobacillus mindensis]
MSKRIIAVAMDINKIPYVNNNEIIITPGEQKIWYTAHTQAIKIPAYVKIGDKLINAFIKKFLKKSTKQDVLQFNYFTRRAALYIQKNAYDAIIFENLDLKNKILPHFKNKNEYVVDSSIA